MTDVKFSYSFNNEDVYEDGVFIYFNETTIIKLKDLEDLGNVISDLESAFIKVRDELLENQ